MQAFPLFPILFLIFLTLKLCSVIAWSWWWVTAPLWGPCAVLLVVFAVVGAVYGLFCVVSKIVN